MRIVDGQQKSRSPFLLQFPLESSLQSLLYFNARTHHAEVESEMCILCWTWINGGLLWGAELGEVGGGGAIVNMCGEEMYAHAPRRLHGPWPRTEVDKE